jgi:hypothetical protein
MGESIQQQIRVGVIHYAPRQDNNTGTTPIHPTNNSPTHNQLPTTPGDAWDGRGISFSSQSSGTDGNLQVPSSDLLRQHGEPKRMHQSDEHVEQIHSPEIDFIDPNNPQPSTSKTIHPRRDTKQPTSDIPNRRHIKSDNSPPRKQAKKGTPSRRKSIIQTLDDTTDGNFQSRSPAPTPNTVTTNDTTDTHHNHLLYTFIIHKSACPNLPPTTQRCPTFAAFDHGDHYHFIYTTKHTNNASRTLNAIIQFIKTDFEGTTEAHTTLQLVRFHRRFLSYLIRKGIRTFNKYGNRAITILGELTRCLLNYNVIYLK